MPRQHTTFRTLPYAALVLAAAALSTGSCSLLNPRPAQAPAADATPATPPVMAITAEPTGRAELLWDTYGVPHIIAQDEGALFYAFGWAQMRAHADLLLRLYGQARGRGAEYWGEPFLASDTWVRTNGIPARAQEWLAAQPAHVRAYLESFVAGMNHYAERFPDAIADAYRAVLPVVPADVLAHQQRLLNYTFLANPGMMTAARRNLGVGAGSNAWAVAPARSASGNALLLANPHLPWGDMFTWFEAHMVAPQLNAYGAALVGMPTLGIAFNDYLGWTHTVNTIDGVDLYDLTTSGDSYMFDGQLRGMEVETQVLRVRQPDGSFRDQQLAVKRSIHGPIIAEREGRAIALRVAGLDAPHLFEQYRDMMRATSRGQFELALSRLQLPLFTVMYADRAGEIMSVFNGRVPVRPAGDWTYWQGVVPGDTSGTLWTDTHTYPGLPRVINPVTGWLQNANDPPWSTTLPFVLSPAFFPAYIAPERPMSFRAQRSARMLAEDRSISFDELLAYRHSTRMEAADHLIQDVIAAARISDQPDARAAADVLEAWDRSASADSRGAVLFLEFFNALQQQRWPGGSLFEVPWTARAPLATPDGLADPRLAAHVLAQAAQRVRARYGALDVPWGDVFRFRRDTLDLPASGGPDDLGIFRVMDFQPVPGDSTKFMATGGDSYVAAIEFSAPVQARTLLIYGNASQPGSPHRTDQLGLAARGEMKLVWLSIDSIMAHLSLREAF